SSGVGGGFIVDGRLLVGRRGNAHEVGHIVVDLDSEAVCGCGGLGHWEALASGVNMPRTASLYASTWRGPRSRAYILAREGRLSPEDLYSHARRGDPFASSLADYLNRVHAAGLASVAAAYDPEAVFLGGSVYLNNEDLILPGVRRYLARYSIWPPELRRATYGHDAVLYGAAAIALEPPG
ncbi:MAG: ROK family protein, partial [Desulfurococcales archaeon]|nr:ROK family protein [Desulfurococcales archaeon]